MIRANGKVHQVELRSVFASPLLVGLDGDVAGHCGTKVEQRFNGDEFDAKFVAD